jgi:hypothetical protein
MKRGFVDLLDPSNDPEFLWQVISGPPCIQLLLQLCTEVSQVTTQLSLKIEN